MKFTPEFRCTAIGSLPFKDVDKALSFVVKYFFDLPFWPQLPKKSPLEGMCIQFSENIPILTLKDKDVVLKDNIDDKALELFYDKVIAKDYEYFCVGKDYASGFYKALEFIQKGYIESDIIKCHVTGPFTFSASVKSDKNKSLFSDSAFFQIINSGLSLKALWQIKKIKALGKKVILFVDEPYLACLGSAFTPLERGNVVKALTELITPLKEEDVLVGAHCCGNTDWPIFIESGFDIISFDAYNYLEKLMLYAKELKSFLLAGGILALGLVPTTDFVGSKINLDSLVKKFQDDLSRFLAKGIDQNLLLRQALVTPSCGMGTLEENISIEIMNLLKEFSQFIRKEHFK